MSVDWIFGIGVLNAALIVVLMVYMRRKHRFLHGRLSVIESRLRSEISVLSAASGGIVLPQTDGWTASEDLLVEVLSLMRALRPKLIVELGSGLSTIVIGAELRRLGEGRLVSVDHAPNFHATTQHFVSVNGLESYVELRLAPLTRLSADSEEFWYDQACLEDLDGIELLLVDGPPIGSGRSRRPALPFFKDRLAADCRILVDDSARPEDRLMLERWRARFPDIQAEARFIERGFAVLRAAGKQNGQI